MKIPEGGWDQVTVTRALTENGLKEGDTVMITLKGTVKGTLPGQVHLLVDSVQYGSLSSFASWSEWFTPDFRPMATIKDWVG